MIFKEFGDPSKPTIILIHGGGLSNWMWQPEIALLQNQYHIVTPILDGHGEAYDTAFESISKSAQQIIEYINQNCSGTVFAICGLSVGAQITVEILANGNNIVQKAIVESALVLPSKMISGMVKPMIDFSAFLIKKRWFAKLQSKQMYLPESMFEDYFRDSVRMSKESLVNLLTDNSNYAVPGSLEKTATDVLIICGQKEYGMMKKSAALLLRRIKISKLKIIPHCGHGVCIKLPQEYVKLMQEHFAT
jgi:pimeloyl-ACP methyl ester carboxylesterase